MNSDSNTAFGLSLSPSEVVQFLALLRLPPPAAPDEGWLRQLIRAVLARIPYQNITAVLRPAGAPRSARIKRDMLEGLGGPCSSINPFLGALLSSLGYAVHLVAGSMDRPDCHVALLCNLNGRRYYIDCGDGKPYFEPMPIDVPTVYTHPFRTYRTYLKGGVFTIENKFDVGWTFNCAVDLRPRTLDSFRQTIHRHYTEASFGPLWRGLRLAYFPQGTVLALRNDRLIWVEKGICQQRKLSSTADWELAIERHFSPLRLPILKAASHFLSYLNS